MHFVLSIDSHQGERVSELILGHNIEAALTTVPGLLSDRLRNPKFVGPPHRMTGIAPEWQGASCGRGAYELTPAAGLGGSEAQLVRMEGEGVTPALHQNGVSVRRKEVLDLELWARAWHQPVELDIEIRPLAKGLEPYDSGTITIGTSWFAPYHLELRIPRSDDEARLSISLSGAGACWIDQVHLRPQGEPLICRGIVETMKSMRIPTLRFPGGIVVNAYQWKNATGPVHLRPASLEAAFHQDWYLNYDFGLDEYLELCADQGITPALTLNVATGTPEEAAGLAAYCRNWFESRSISPPEVHWHIANHPYANTTAHMTPAMYVDTLKHFIPAVRTAYPDSRIVAVMGRGDLTSEGAQASWRDAMLDEALDLIDVIEVQTYGGLGVIDEPAEEYTGGISSPDEQIASLIGQLRSIESDLTSADRMLSRRGLGLKLGIAEWNWWMQASHWDGRDFEEPPTTLHLLFSAGMIHTFARSAPRFAVAHFYNLVNCMGILNHRRADVEVTAMVELFKLYRPALPGNRREVSITPEHDGSPEFVDTLCLENSEGLWLFIVNYHWESDVRYEIPDTSQESTDIVCLAGSSTVAPAEAVPGPDASWFGKAPPLSVIRLRLR